ncbi:hypothetical protein F5877DRAFT_76721 [Lentinula edodes]|nr:hypothetical protein F5877DRAFT_76721 [Lentinula edodes]
MKDTSPSGPFLSLARELRDKIYDFLLYTPIGTPSTSISGHLIDVSEPYWMFMTRPKLDWHWQIPVSRGSCFGILYACRQVYAEVVECIERQDGRGGMSFELEIALIGVPHPEDRTILGVEQVWPSWIVLPLCTYPVFLHDSKNFAGSPLTSTGVNAKCKNLDVSLKLQSEVAYRWLVISGLSRLTQILFTMLARFLLYGPLGLYRNTDTNRVWNIDILTVNVMSVGTFTDPYSGQSRPVPIEVVEESVGFLSRYINELCTEGALSDRVRVVRFAVEGELKREWLINRGEGLSPLAKKDWAAYGWKIDAQDRSRESNLHHVVNTNIAPRKRKNQLTATNFHGEDLD